jgi:hypothetical protein
VPFSPGYIQLGLSVALSDYRCLKPIFSLIYFKNQFTFLQSFAIVQLKASKSRLSDLIS